MLGGAAVALALSSAAPASAQSPAGATGAPPGTAPNAPPPPSTQTRNAAPPGQPDVQRRADGADTGATGAGGSITAEQVGTRSQLTSYQAKAAEQNLTAAGARADQQ